MLKEIDFKIQLHNKLCEVADLITHYHNPCQWENGKCKTGNPCCFVHQYFNGEGKCDFLGKEGCTIPNLNCKLYFCEKVNLPEEMKEAIKLLIRFNNLYLEN